MNIYYPDISCVVIGINCEGTISTCLESVRKIDYSKPIDIIYADGGSRDKSVAMARSVAGIKVIELNLKDPTPGKGRNAGWHAADSEWIQFFDGDTIAAKDWLVKAVKYIEDDVGVIFGLRRERVPNKNWFHIIADLEWENMSLRDKFFGGDILIRRSILEETSGYDESLFGGADPELSVRVCCRGWKIRRVNELMCYHDINMTRFRQYLRRGVRCGYAYAEAGLKMLRYGEKNWFLKTIKTLFKCIIILLLTALCLFPGFAICGLLAVSINFYPISKAPVFKKRFKTNFKNGLIYSLHCSIVVWPQFFGMLKYFWNRAM